MSADPHSPEVLISIPTDAEAASIIAALRSKEIKAFTTGGYTAGFRAEAPGQINIVVRQEDLKAAKQILAEIDNPEVDWSQVDVGKPESL